MLLSQVRALLSLNSIDQLAIVMETHCSVLIGKK